MGGDDEVEGFAPEAHVFGEFDYRDVKPWADQVDHPMYRVFRTTPHGIAPGAVARAQSLARVISIENLNRSAGCSETEISNTTSAASM